MLANANASKYPYWRLSLLTIIILVIVAGILLGLNMRRRDFTNPVLREIQQEVHYGWPEDIAFFSPPLNDGIDHVLHLSEKRKTAVAINLGTNFVILLVIAAISEYIIRRRDDSRSRTTPSESHNMDIR